MQINCKIFTEKNVSNSRDLSCLKPQIQPAIDNADMQKIGENTTLYGSIAKPLIVRHSRSSKMNMSEWKNAQMIIAWRSEFSSRLYSGCLIQTKTPVIHPLKTVHFQIHIGMKIIQIFHSIMWSNRNSNKIENAKSDV